MKEIRELIKSHNWKSILNWGIALSEIERLNAIPELHKIDVNEELIKGKGYDLRGEEREAFYDNWEKTRASLHYAQIVCTRNFEDVKKTINTDALVKHSALYWYLFQPALGHEPLLEFYNLYKPNYLDNYLQALSKDRSFNADFKLIWILYKNDWLQFNEEFFVRRLFTIYGFNNNHIKDAQFLIENPEVIEKVFLQFYNHEVPILDIIKCESIYYSNRIIKACIYWTEVFKILIEKNLLPDRHIIKNLLESLLNNWKKPHLDWHVRILELFQPTRIEYLEYQQLLFACLNLGHVSIVNFAVKCIELIYKEKQFAVEDFLINVQSLFAKEKCGKSILSVLQIIDYLAQNNPAIQQDLHTYLVVALLQTDAKVQTKTAQLLVKYTKAEILEEVIDPYTSLLKQSAKTILNVADTEQEEQQFAHPKIEIQPVLAPSSWNDLLFHIGACINTKSAADIDLFLEGLNQLQNQIPIDYAEQIKPYIKQLRGCTCLAYLNYFFENWLNIRINKNYSLTDYARELDSIPFLQHKCELLFNKLKNKSNLPFLSTPTHLPFYIHPDVFLDRLLAYEKKKKKIDIEDLIIACNRILLSVIDDIVKQKAKKLTGEYALAIQYLLGVHDIIEPNETLLPLWTQVTRTKNPEKTYSEFSATSAKDYPAVTTPFTPSYAIKIDKNEYCTWYRLNLEKKWNDGRRWYSDSKPAPYPPLFYYTASLNLANNLDISYQISLVPQYIDTLITRYIPDTASGNEVTELEHCLYPLQALLENKLKVHHGGWLYIAVCLLFEKKVSRDLAAAYIEFALQENFVNHEYLAVEIGKLISLKYAPVNRLLEYIDKGISSKQVKTFQLKVLEQCILSVDIKHTPINFKKIIAAFYELSGGLQIEPQVNIADKLKELKK